MAIGKPDGLDAQVFQCGKAFLRRFGQPIGDIFALLVGVQSGFAGNGFIEAEHG
ncbi:hypothetical protein [Hymenobacter ruricola]|uniref:Uncharacterized protein n=1 Tax=Hymenobacter ruricola TaxID=2791023 RepID=A0ABS0I060_9BACT|nr:hypothetical protein [Hymenobacter ruricola]MBF9219992.1 hypothetical protein [Hymenobacter ruricola]